MACNSESDILRLMADIWANGAVRRDRTGVGTRARFGAMLRFSLADGRIPLLTTKRVYWKSAVRELIWFLTGSTSIRPLVAEGVHIWTDWPLDKYRRESGDSAISRDDFEARIIADDGFCARWGDLGPVYGKQWRRWQGPDGREHDQIAALLESLAHHPASRRHIFTGWNVAELADMALPPCHMTYQYFVEDQPFGPPRLSGILYQRSCDMGLGFPFNILEASLLLRMLSQQLGMVAGELIWMGADVHLYENHAHLVETQLAREPRDWPLLEFARQPASLFDYRLEDFIISGYDPHPAIAAPVAV